VRPPAGFSIVLVSACATGEISPLPTAPPPGVTAEGSPAATGAARTPTDARTRSRTLGAASWTTDGTQADGQLGRSVAIAGDVDGDGFDDVLAGEPGWDDDAGNDAGAAYLFAGGDSGPAATPTWTSVGDAAFGEHGFAVAAAGDLDGDGFADVVVGAPSYDALHSEEGRAQVFMGGTGGLASSADWTYATTQLGSLAGWAVSSAGDVDGDGDDELLVGIPSWDGGHRNEGRVLGFPGDPAGLDTYDWLVESNQNSAYFGSALSSAGDVDADGYADVAIGAWYYDETYKNEGTAWVYLGAAGGLRSTPDWAAYGGANYAYMGWSLAGAGDVDDDGFDDLLVGMHGDDSGAADAGAAMLFSGSAAGLGATPSWTATGASTSANFGRAVAAAGDLDGDGIADVVIAAPYQDGTDNEMGWAGAYLGRSGGPGTSVAWETTGSDEGETLGLGLAGGGDIDGDGLDDLVVGSPGAATGGIDAGRVTVYAGSYDVDGDGYTSGSGGDCDDGDPDVYPGAPETPADGIDQDCDGLDHCFVDADLDGVGGPSTGPGDGEDCSASGMSARGDDCDDTDRSVNPEEEETPGTGVDEDCDGVETCYVDLDGDGYGGSVADSADLDCTGDGEASAAGDCDDDDPAVNPGATETPADGTDTDCDGTELCWDDRDADGYGATTTERTTALDCVDDGVTTNTDDCNDLRAAAHPGATEVLGNGYDEDCDGSEICYLDADGDGFGSTATVVSTDTDCYDAGEARNADDCDDSDTDIYPGAPEIEGDGIDQDCDGLDPGSDMAETGTDTGSVVEVGVDADADTAADLESDTAAPLPAASPSVTLCASDLDGDGVGTLDTVTSDDGDCDDPGESTRTDDCDDHAAAISPAAVEIAADEVDQDCDRQELCYEDLDGDGYGSSATALSADLSCGSSGVSPNHDDCDDADPDKSDDEDCDGADPIPADDRPADTPAAPAEEATLPGATEAPTDTGSDPADDPAADPVTDLEPDPAPDTGAEPPAEEIAGDSAADGESCLPVAESCNGRDDDCDGTVDEGCPTADGDAGGLPGGLGGELPGVGDAILPCGCGARSGAPVGALLVAVGLAAARRRSRSG
jgi:hypothetical protein